MSHRGFPVRSLCEVAAALATAAGHYLCQHVLLIGPVFIAVAVVGWGTYIVHRLRTDPQARLDWGLSRAGLAPTTAVVGAMSVLSALLMAAFGWWTGQMRMDWLFWALLLSYPIYGLVQQLIVQGVVANALQDLGFTRAAVIVLTAAAFGLVHYPVWPLMIATFGLGLVFTPIFLRWRNLWPLALAHGWLGAAFYLWVMGKDPLEQLPGLFG